MVLKILKIRNKSSNRNGAADFVTMTNLHGGKMKRSGSAKSLRSVRSAGSRPGSRSGSLSNPAFVDLARNRFGTPGKSNSKVNRTHTSSVRSRSRGGGEGRQMERSSSVKSNRG